VIFKVDEASTLEAKEDLLCSFFLLFWSAAEEEREIDQLYKEILVR